MWCDVGGGLVEVCIFHSQKMHVYLIFSGENVPGIKLLIYQDEEGRYGGWGSRARVAKLTECCFMNGLQYKKKMVLEQLV